MIEWQGTKKEVYQVIDCVMESIKESYPDLSNKKFNQLFCEAIIRNIVQNEIAEMMAYINDNE
jgi:hypothetical protein